MRRFGGPHAAIFLALDWKAFQCIGKLSQKFNQNIPIT